MTAPQQRRPVRIGRPVQASIAFDIKKPNALGGGIRRAMKVLAEGEQRARKDAAQIATQTSRSNFRYLRPANAPKRPGRPSTGGKFADALKWEAKPGPTGMVEFDLAHIDKRVRYWIILEIGTGQSATMRRADKPNPRGRPSAGATYVRTVKSQVGRRISPNLAFGTGPRGTYTPFGAATGQQLYLRRQLKKAPVGPRRAQNGVYISREVIGQHFVQKGGREGFRAYRTSVRAAARRAFAGRGYRP